ncbi:MAG: hypothetical protein R3249_10635 [Nitriliruptorales bacterium]|nr:hypothetical protein [Nitriliruptorales bacterium]
MTDRDLPDRPPRTARLGLERAVAEEVQRLAAALDLAFLEADRMLREGDARAAGDAIDASRVQLAAVDDRLRRAVSDAMVERAAGEVMAAAVEHLQDTHEDTADVAVSPAVSSEPRASGLLGRLPAAVAAAAAVVVGLTAMLAGPRDVTLDPVADDGSVLATDGAADTETVGADSEAPTATAQTTPADGTSTLGTPDTGSTDLVSPAIVELVDRVLAEATSDVFEEIVQSPLLDEVEGDDLEAALDLLEQRLDEAAQDAGETSDPTTDQPDPSPAPTEASTETSTEDPAGGDVLGDGSG